MCQGSPGVKMIREGNVTQIYTCCKGDLCNVASATQSFAAELFASLPSSSYCDASLECFAHLSESYKCLLSSVPDMQPSDPCFGALLPQMGCLARRCQDPALPFERPLAQDQIQP